MSEQKPLVVSDPRALAVHLTANLDAWYLDKFGMERQCIVVTARGLFEGVLGVVGLDGELLDVDPRDVFYVPNDEGPTRTVPIA